VSGGNSKNDIPYQFNHILLDRIFEEQGHKKHRWISLVVIGILRNRSQKALMDRFSDGVTSDSLKFAHSFDIKRLLL